MDLGSWLAEAQGAWRGISRLHLPWLEDEDARIESSASTLVVQPSGRFGIVGYTWARDDGAHEGLITLLADPSAGEATSVHGGWADTWHQSAATMALAGDLTDGVIRLAGAYGAGDGPDWGWRIELGPVERSADGQAVFTLRMVNLPPDGPETWAVEGVYRRV